jgi:protoporphyrinogen oxidase
MLGSAMTPKETHRTFILGAGMTGLAAGIASGLPLFEASDAPGGICASYYIRPREKERLPKSPEDQEAYRFENGGGHWIFGGEPTILNFINSHTLIKRHIRRSAVYFQDRDLYIPYPIQNHLRFLDPEIAAKALGEMAQRPGACSTMKEWQKGSFGPTLCELFFFPFHELYTAGLYDRITPQDGYKSPVDLPLAIRGALDASPAVGYNATFVYPEKDLGILARRMASRCQVNYNLAIEGIHVQEKEVIFADGSIRPYDQLICTLPLSKTMELSCLKVEHDANPHTSVLVLNIGAVRGEKCPDHHWLYNTRTESGFHRVGFYSNVDASFLPLSARKEGSRVSIYVEKAYKDGNKPAEESLNQYVAAVVKELQDWEYIGDVEVIDPTWIEVAYTWNWPKSVWTNNAMKKLEEYGIYQVGRYARWNFQGIADSIRDGFFAGASFRV